MKQSALTFDKVISIIPKQKIVQIFYFTVNFNFSFQYGTKGIFEMSEFKFQIRLRIVKFQVLTRSQHNSWTSQSDFSPLILWLYFYRRRNQAVYKKKFISLAMGCLNSDATFFWEFPSPHLEEQVNKLLLWCPVGLLSLDVSVHTLEDIWRHFLRGFVLFIWITAVAFPFKLYYFIFAFLNIWFWCLNDV